MDISVSISAGSFRYELTITETGPDGIREAQASATAHALALVGDTACAEAALTPAVSDPTE